MAKTESNKAVANLVGWLTREAYWAAPFEATLHAHTAVALDVGQLTHEELSEILGDAGSGLLFGCVFEDFAAQRFETAPQNIVDDYLKRRGWRDSVPCRRYMEALRDAVISVYEVTAVSSGKWVEVRDLVRGGEPVRVFEHSASQQIVRWDRIGVRVVDYLGQKVFTGALLAYTVEQSEELLGLIEEEIGNTLSTLGLNRADPNLPEVRTAIADTLRTLPSAFTACWLARHVEANDAPKPDLVNTEGDPIVFAETRFTIREGAEKQIVSRLDEQKGLHRVDDSPPSWDWHGKTDSHRNMGSTGMMLQTQSMATGEQVLGSLKLQGSTLSFSTNSIARKDRGVEILRVALGDLISTALTSLTDIEQALAQARASKSTKAGVKDEIPPDVAAGVMRQFLDQHYRGWIDTPLPVLDGRSPKEAVRTKRGKDEVVALLKTAENMDERRCRETGQPAYDFGWLWQELGLASRRV
jgi:hypothetical protein